MRREHAETVALQALGWLAAEAELLPVFLSSTGFSADEMRQRATEPEVLAAVLDFVTMDDAWVAAFCGAVGLPPEAPMQARAHLPGGDLPHWT